MPRTSLAWKAYSSNAGSTEQKAPAIKIGTAPIKEQLQKAVPPKTTTTKSTKPKSSTKSSHKSSTKKVNTKPSVIPSINKAQEAINKIQEDINETQGSVPSPQVQEKIKSAPKVLTPQGRKEWTEKQVASKKPPELSTFPKPPLPKEIQKINPLKQIVEEKKMPPIVRKKLETKTVGIYPRGIPPAIPLADKISNIKAEPQPKTIPSSSVGNIYSFIDKYGKVLPSSAVERVNKVISPVTSKVPQAVKALGPQATKEYINLIIANSSGRFTQEEANKAALNIQNKYTKELSDKNLLNWYKNYGVFYDDNNNQINLSELNKRGLKLTVENGTVKFIPKTELEVGKEHYNELIRQYMTQAGMTRDEAEKTVAVRLGSVALMESPLAIGSLLNMSQDEAIKQTILEYKKGNWSSPEEYAEWKIKQIPSRPFGIGEPTREEKIKGIASFIKQYQNKSLKDISLSQMYRLAAADIGYQSALKEGSFVPKVITSPAMIEGVITPAVTAGVGTGIGFVGGKIAGRVASETVRAGAKYAGYGMLGVMGGASAYDIYSAGKYHTQYKNTGQSNVPALFWNVPIKTSKGGVIYSHRAGGPTDIITRGFTHALSWGAAAEGAKFGLKLSGYKPGSVTIKKDFGQFKESVKKIPGVKRFESQIKAYRNLHADLKAARYSYGQYEKMYGGGNRFTSFIEKVPGLKSTSIKLKGKMYESFGSHQSYGNLEGAYSHSISPERITTMQQLKGRGVYDPGILHYQSMNIPTEYEIYMANKYGGPAVRTFASTQQKGLAKRFFEGDKTIGVKTFISPNIKVKTEFQMGTGSMTEGGKIIREPSLMRKTTTLDGIKTQRTYYESIRSTPTSIKPEIRGFRRFDTETGKWMEYWKGGPVETEGITSMSFGKQKFAVYSDKSVFRPPTEGSKMPSWNFGRDYGENLIKVTGREKFTPTETTPSKSISSPKTGQQLVQVNKKISTRTSTRPSYTQEYSLTKYYPSETAKYPSPPEYPSRVTSLVKPRKTFIDFLREAEYGVDSYIHPFWKGVAPTLKSYREKVPETKEIQKDYSIDFGDIYGKPYVGTYQHGKSIYKRKKGFVTIPKRKTTPYQDEVNIYQPKEKGSTEVSYQEEFGETTPEYGVDYDIGPVTEQQEESYKEVYPHQPIKYEPFVYASKTHGVLKPKTREDDNIIRPFPTPFIPGYPGGGGAGKIGGFGFGYPGKIGYKYKKYDVAIFKTFQQGKGSKKVKLFKPKIFKG